MRVQTTAVRSVRLTGVFDFGRAVVYVLDCGGDGIDVSIVSTDILSDRATRPLLLPPRAMICGRALGRINEAERCSCKDRVAVLPVEEK